MAASDGHDRWRPNPEAPSVVSPPVIAAPTDRNTNDDTNDDTNDGTTVPVRLGRESDAPSDFDELFRAHYDRLVRSLTVVSGDRERAADAVQEAFVKAHLRWRRVGRLDDPAGWVRRVAINRLRDDHRRDGRKQRALSRLASRTPTHHEPPDEPDEIGRLLATLPRQQRLTTSLYYVGGLSVAEIAETLSIAEGSVKSHLHDARRRLRAALDQEGTS
jgi:RNA polymerase sigma-70 factor, ECF subfamily